MEEPASEDRDRTAGTRGRRAPDLSGVDVARLRARDPEALAALFEASFDRIYSLLHRLCGERAQTEDLAQEVFARVHGAIETLDPSRDPWPWLVTVAYNVFRDFARSRSYLGQRRSVSFEDRPELARGLQDGSRGPEGALLEQERARLVEDAIRALPREQRETVLLHALAGMSHLEVARLTGASPAASRKTYSRAIAAIGRTVARAYA